MAVQELIDILGEDARIIFERSLELCKRDVDGINYRTENFSQYYGKLPLMVTSGLRDTVGRLTDDKGYSFKSIKCEGLCYNVILGDRPLSLHDYEVTRMYYFTDETVKQVKDVLSDDPKYIRDRKYTRGHFEKGI
jgi:putative protease